MVIVAIVLLLPTYLSKLLQKVLGLDFNEDEVVLALSEDTTALQNYAIGFWKPLPAKKDYEEMFFHVQVNSALIGKLPIMNDLVGKLAQQADFLDVRQMFLLVFLIVPTTSCFLHLARC